MEYSSCAYRAAGVLALAGLLVTSAPRIAEAGAAPPSPAAVLQPEINLSSFANGAWILKRPPEYDESWSAFWLLDERSQTGWATPKGVVAPQELLVILPEVSVIKRIEFDSAAADGDEAGSRTAKDVLVEVSNQGPTSGFEAIGSFSLKPKKDKQGFAVTKSVPGRWLRLTIKNNHGSPDYIELFDFRAYGEQNTKSPVPNLSGTYATNFGNFHLQQDGAAVSGCYEHGGGLVTNGGVDGRVTRFTWIQGDLHGPAVLTFSPDGKEWLGLWWNEGQTDTAGGIWTGKKLGDSVGSCPHWKGARTGASQLAQDLGQSGRTRIYGISFDTDSDLIKPESKVALDDVVRLAKEKGDWKFLIEGHTDQTASAAHNQVLSEKRAEAVKAYLITAGVAPARLSSQGLGATKPVADNATSLGRAQNRRVELVKR